MPFVLIALLQNFHTNEVIRFSLDPEGLGGGRTQLQHAVTQMEVTFQFNSSCTKNYSPSPAQSKR